MNREPEINKASPLRDSLTQTARIPTEFSPPPEAQERLAVLIADDHTLVAQALSSLIERDFNIIATVGNGSELLKAAARRAPDVALIDISMPEMSGFEAAQKLLEIVPRCKVIFVSAHAMPDFVRQAFAVGGRGYLLKRAAASELFQALKTVISGNVHISVDIANDVLSAFLRPPSIPLTGRQRQVLRLVSKGKTHKEIAMNLNISVKTAQFHKSSIMEKLHLNTTAELTKYAFDHGMIS
jgi:DNA-binding NarL/FixJ family response regulator